MRVLVQFASPRLGFEVRVRKVGSGARSRGIGESGGSALWPWNESLTSSGKIRRLRDSTLEGKEELDGLPFALYS